ncbi:hypothetical protein [Vogesella indigofera]|uniref:hypothetical protein n=1 Tax=Vogesella indigofera TaxID=45465 RepID=UPI00234EE7C0|nr:hypothetical protein [Vogesella indigofera]MDC7696837.1 hypothetical protein [Vogesella indigofera]
MILDIKDLVGGALDNHKFYLKCIAIPNCNEFFDFYDSDFRTSYVISKEIDKYVCMRKFLVAVESLSNVFDYFYHEFHLGVMGSVPQKKITDKEFKIAALKLIGLSGVGDVVDMANAYKHSRRSVKVCQVRTAKELLGRRRFNVDARMFKFDYLDGGFYLPNKSQVLALRESLEFWTDYCNERACVKREDFSLLLR